MGPRDSVLLVHQIPIGTLDFDAVRPCSHRHCRRVAEVIDNGSHFIGTQRSRLRHGAQSVHGSHLTG
jgi:hypothetical protein